MQISDWILLFLTLQQLCPAIVFGFEGFPSNTQNTKMLVVGSSKTAEGTGASLAYSSSIASSSGYGREVFSAMDTKYPLDMGGLEDFSKNLEQKDYNSYLQLSEDLGRLKKEQHNALVTGLLVNVAGAALSVGALTFLRSEDNATFNCYYSGRCYASNRSSINYPVLVIGLLIQATGLVIQFTGGPTKDDVASTLNKYNRSSPKVPVEFSVNIVPTVKDYPQLAFGFRF